MIDLPPGCRVDDIDRLADWAEAIVLIDGDEVSRDEMIQAFTSSGIVDLEEAMDKIPGDDAGEAEREDAADRLAEDVLALCSARSLTLRDAYPFQVDSDLFSLRADVEVDAYAFLLIADLGHGYAPLKDALVPDGASGLLLEKVVEGALRGLFGHANRFGWPREAGWPTGIDARVERLYELLEVPMDSLTGKTESSANDRTLDVVAIFKLPAGLEASLVILTQVAAGKNWKKKSAEPSEMMWHNLMIWNCRLVRAVALP